MSATGHGGAVLVTGASEGIGRALASVFAARGHDLVLTARNSERLETLAEELGDAHGIRTWIVVQDLGERDADGALQRAVASLGVEIDILVNNAGYGLHGPFLDREIDGLLGMVDVNIRSLVGLSHRYGAMMRQRRSGRILNVASTVAFLPGPMMAIYFASKAFVFRFTESFRAELAGTGVSVTCLCPGITEAKFQERAGMTGTRLAGLSVATAESVAEAAYAGLMAGRGVVLPGFRNKLAPLAERFLPRAVMRLIIHGLMARR